MSGHSKWSTIKRQKGANDAKRGNLFTKLGNAITVVVREGGESPDSNFKLRLAIEAARAANMPKDNINRAIDRGSGKGASLRSLIERAGGSLGGVGSVAWMFKPMGEIEVLKEDRSFDDIMLVSADLGAHDAEEAGDRVLIYTSPNELENLKQKLLNSGFQVSRSELTQRQTNIVRLEDLGKAKQVLDLVDKIEDLEDVQKVYANFDISENVMQRAIV